MLLRGALAEVFTGFSALDQERLAMLGALVDDFTAHGSRVEFVLLPYHPLAYEVMAREYPRAIEAEQAFRRLATERGIEVLGDYDPSQSGCTAEEFYDWYHATPTCLERLLR